MPGGLENSHEVGVTYYIDINAIYKRILKRTGVIHCILLRVALDKSEINKRRKYIALGTCSNTVIFGWTYMRVTIVTTIRALKNEERRIIKIKNYRRISQLFPCTWRSAFSAKSVAYRRTDFCPRSPTEVRSSHRNTFLAIFHILVIARLKKKSKKMSLAKNHETTTIIHVYMNIFVPRSNLKPAK